MIKEGFEVGTSGSGDVIANHCGLRIDEDGCGHIALTPEQARHLGAVLIEMAAMAETEALEAAIREAQGAESPS